MFQGCLGLRWIRMSTPSELFNHLPILRISIQIGYKGRQRRVIDSNGGKGNGIIVRGYSL
jgi:hypothetical protein